MEPNPTGSSHILQDLKSNYTKLYNRFAIFSLWLGSYTRLVKLCSTVQDRTESLTLLDGS